MTATVAKWLMIVLAMFWLGTAQAEERASDEKEVSTVENAVAPGSASHGEVQRKGRGVTVFWVVLVLSLLFVLGSALALNALGGKPRLPPGKGKDSGSGS